MGYKDYSSYPDIRPRRMTVLDHFPQGECLSTNKPSSWTILHRENVCPPTILQPGPSSTGRMFVHQQSVLPGPFSAWRMSVHQHTDYPYSWQSYPTLVVVSMAIRTMPYNRTQLCLSIVVHNYYPVVQHHN
jgi:hypothetical protein